MGMYKVNDRVRVTAGFKGLSDIAGKTGVVTDETIGQSDYVLVKLDNPDPENVPQHAPISLREVWLTRHEDN